MMAISAGLLTVRRPGRVIAIETISTSRREQALIATGHSPEIARRVAHGALVVRVDAIDLGRYIGLLAPTDTAEARAVGLVK